MNALSLITARKHQNVVRFKKIRTFRNMTQAELGAALSWGDKGANRLAQYETNYRVPRKDLVTEMAKILDVNPLALYEPTTMDASELMEILFWIDEFNPAAINLFQLETYPGENAIPVRIPLSVITILITGLLIHLLVCGLIMGF